MNYVFNGHEEAGKVINTSGTYTNIKTPLNLYDILSQVWCEYTCAPRLREEWSSDNKTAGQCSITAFLVQDIFGGEVYGMNTGKGIHCYNVIDGIWFDLTSEQFGERAEKLLYQPDKDEKQDRNSAYHFGKEEKYQRYLYLKKAVADY